MSSTAWLFILFGILGMFSEVVFTAILDIFKTRRFRLHGFSFLWMFPIYGLLALFFQPVAEAISPLPWLARGLIYMIGIYAVEFITGTLLTALTRSHIWEYTDRWNYKGQITLCYAPVWFTVGLVIEKYYGWVENVSRAIANLT